MGFDFFYVLCHCDELMYYGNLQVCYNIDNNGKLKKKKNGFVGKFQLNNIIMK